MYTKTLTLRTFVWMLLLLSCLSMFRAQAQKKIPAHMISGADIWIGIDDEKLPEISATLTKWYGKKVSDEIIEYGNANNWPRKVIEAMTAYDTASYTTFFKQFRVWQIPFPGKSYSLVEIRPQENTFLNDTSFRHTFYMYVDVSVGLAAGHIKTAPKKLPTEISGDDATNRKTIMAAMKKKFLTPPRKLIQEFNEVPMKGDEEFTLSTHLNKEFKHTVLVITNGEDNELKLAYDDPELDETSFLKPNASENINGYTVTRFSFFTPGVDARVSMNANKDATFSFMLLSEKDDAGYAAWQRKATADRAAAARARQEARAKNAGRWAAEMDEQRQHINKIKDAADYFIRRTERSFDYTNSHAEKEDWTWNQYLKYYNDMQEDYSYMVKVFNNNLTGMSPDNPDKPRVRSWLSNASTQIDKMNTKIKSFNKDVQDSKSPSYYSFRMMYQEILGYARKLKEAEL